MNLLYYFFFALFCANSVDARAWTPSEIPSLGRDVWVSDPNLYMSHDQRAKVNHLLDSNSYLKSRIFPSKDHPHENKPYQVAVLIIDEMAPSYSASEFAETVFNRWGLGYKGLDNGILVFVSVNDRVLSVTPGVGVTLDMLSWYDKQRVIDTIKPYLKKQRYGMGLYAGTVELVNRLKYMDTYEQYSYDSSNTAFVILTIVFCGFTSWYALYYLTRILLPVTNGGVLEREERERNATRSTHTTHMHHTTHNYHHDKPNNSRWYNPFSWRYNPDLGDDNIYSRTRPVRPTVRPIYVAPVLPVRHVSPIHAPTAPVAKTPQAGKTRPDSSTVDSFDSPATTTAPVPKSILKPTKDTSNNSTWKNSARKSTLDDDSDSIDSEPDASTKSTKSKSTGPNLRKRSPVATEKPAPKPKGGTTRQGSSTVDKW